MSDIGHVFLTKAWIFQAIIAGPTFVILGLCAIFGLWGDSYFTLYDFSIDLFTAILASGIIFLVLAQRQLPNVGKLWTYRFELVKSGLATTLWVVLMLDAIWGPKRYYYDYQRIRRIVASAIAVVLLFLFFYPTVVYTRYDLQKQRREGQRASEGAESGRDAGERAPLLAEPA